MVFEVGLINGDIYIYPWLTHIELRCYGNKIWDEIGYNSAYVKIFLRYFNLIT